jgi:hypothetical protein
MGLRRVPIPLDEYPIHQSPLPMSRVVTSDRNFYDRCYLNAHDRTGDVFLVSGLGVYPNLGVIDAYAAVRCGDRQWAVQFSDALSERSLEQRVGGYEIEVTEPLRRLHVRCAAADGGIEFDLSWTGAFPAVQEEPHLLLSGGRPVPRSAAGAGGCGRAIGSSTSPTTGGWDSGTGPGGSGPPARKNRQGGQSRRERKASGGCTCRCASSPAR